jgi:serine hydrolase
MTRHLLVPGRNKPRPEHWQRRWADAHPDYTWAPPPPGPPFVLEDRVAALHAAITADDEPAILIAHSGGCLTTVVWAARHTGPVQAALLVAPPYVDPDREPGPGQVAWVIPRQPLPFRTHGRRERRLPALPAEPIVDAWPPHRPT